MRQGKRSKPPESERRPGPPSGYAMLPWLLLGLGAFSNLVQGRTPNAWIGGAGLFTFNSLYIFVVFRSFDPVRRRSVGSRWALLAMGVMTFGLAGGYGGAWLVFFPLLGLACGSVLRGKSLIRVAAPLSVCAGLIGWHYEGWDAVTIAYGTFLSMMVTAVILALAETIMELRDTRQELARSAVEQERLRFSRDLHDLLGHTLSVVVVKAEAARRLAPLRLEAALSQISDIESVGRLALTEIREAVTGYREGSLSTELDRARSALTAAGIEPVVRQSGPPLGPRTEALLGWVVREAVTNAVRHSAASHCEIALRGTPEQVVLTVTDDGASAQPDPSAAPDGTGLKGLTERLAAAGGSLEAGPGARGFRVRAVLPVDAAPPAAGPGEETNKEKGQAGWTSCP